VTNILTGNGDQENQEDKGEVLTKIMDDLKMSENDLGLCHGRTATKTARHIMKFLYPYPKHEDTIKNMDSNIVQSIISK
jgi:hypothetical protein